ncbi:tetratricopeptide repeat protein [Aeromonas caviae]
MKQLNTLKAEGRFEEARQHGLLQLIAYPAHAELHYEVAGLHDMLGRETEAIPLYQKAVSLGLGEASLRGALLGLGSTYRTTGRHAEALATFDEALSRFPDAVEFKVFRAMTLLQPGAQQGGDGDAAGDPRDHHHGSRPASLPARHGTLCRGSGQTLVNARNDKAAQKSGFF